MTAPCPATLAHATPDRPACRPGCGACCIAPSISSAIPGLPQGKAAGVPCIQLDEQLRCRLFGQPGRPAVCGQLQPSWEMCGTMDDQGAHALVYLHRLERLTAPETPAGPQAARPVGSQPG